MFFQSLKNIFGPKTVLLASLALSYFGINNSGLNGESSHEISSFLPEPEKITPKLRPINPKSQQDHQSSWFYWILFGALLGSAAGYVYYCYYKGSSAKKNSPLLPRKYTSKSSRRGFLNCTGNHCFANALLVCLIHLPGFKEKISRAAALKNNSNLVLKSLADLFIAISHDQKRLDTPTTEARKKDFCDKIAKSSPEVKFSSEEFFLSFLDSSLL